MSYYKEIEEILREMNKNEASSYRSTTLPDNASGDSKTDSFMHFADKGI